MTSSMYRSVSLVVVSAILGLGCGPSIAPGHASGAATSGGSTSTTDSMLTATGTTQPGTTTQALDPDDTGSTTADDRDSLLFLDGFDGAGVTFECDLFLQDCGEGEKCMPWANDGGDVWNATRCSPIEPAPGAVGDACTVEGGPTSGLDTCDGQTMCWDVSPETLVGACTPFCIGTAEAPTCTDPNARCATEEATALALCLPICDPLLQDCVEGQGCYPVQSFFLCVPDRSGELGAAGDPCEYLDVCDPGRVCLDASAVSTCEAPGCCTAMCDLTDPMPPCLPDQTCLPWYAAGMAPAGYEDVGVCSLPA